MSRIPALDPQTATGTTKNMLDGVQKGLGATPNLFRVAAQSPAVLEAMTTFFGAVTKGHLNAKTRESIALAISEFDRCNYCLSAHTALGKGAGLSQTEIDDARHAKADDTRLQSILTFARAIAEKRGRVTDEDYVAVTRAGLTDAEIVDVVANVVLTTFTNYINEVAKTEIDFPLVTHHAH